MPERTPPHVRRKGQAYGRRDRLIIGSGDEDAPTVAASRLEELGIDPESLATAPKIARRIRDEHDMSQRHAEVRRAREASDRVLRSRDHHPWGQEPSSPEPSAQRHEPLQSASRPDESMSTALVIGVALLPLLLAIAAAVWLLTL